MTIQLSHDIFCDQCGHWENILVSPSVQKTRARSKAKEWGWTRARKGGQMVDLCPVCSGKETLDTRSSMPSSHSDALGNGQRQTISVHELATRR